MCILNYLNQCQRMICNFRDNLCLLRSRGMINASLQNTASMSMSSNLNTLTADSIEYKLEMIIAQPIKAFLNDMIAV